MVVKVRLQKPFNSEADHSEKQLPMPSCDGNFSAARRHEIFESIVPAHSDLGIDRTHSSVDADALHGQCRVAGNGTSRSPPTRSCGPRWVHWSAPGPRHDRQPQTQLGERRFHIRSGHTPLNHRTALCRGLLCDEGRVRRSSGSYSAEAVMRRRSESTEKIHRRNHSPGTNP